MECLCQLQERILYYNEKGVSLFQQDRIQELCEALTELADKDSVYVPFTQPLLELANEFATEAIEDALQKYLMDGQEHGE